jgi:hypothetical protein
VIIVVFTETIIGYYNDICLQEMHNYVTEIEDLYERMSGGKALDPYINLGIYINNVIILRIDRKTVVTYMK